MMMRGSTYLWIAVALGLATLPVCGRAAVHGKCSNCHTMHNSQNNQPMTYNGEYTTVENPGGSATPNVFLLRGNCLACHTGDNNGGTVPFVYTTSSGGPTYTTYATISYDPTTGVISGGDSTGGNTLAGGNFWWVDQGTDADGHNVDMLPNNPVDDTLTSIPGYTGATWNLVTNPLTCAGQYGCHGKRAIAGDFAAMKGAHHTNNSSQVRDGSTLGDSFRFLNGIKGIEASDWEFTVGSSLHNEYYGQARASYGDTLNTHTISYLCAECHGDFHDHSSGNTDAGIKKSGSTPGWGSPWIRHPTDFDMQPLFSSTTTKPDYGGYGGSTHKYMPQAPVASDDLSVGVDSTVNTAGHAIVMCISCHRAHGSPYASLLRWNYRGWPGNGGFNGCNICHTSKD